MDAWDNFDNAGKKYFRILKNEVRNKESRKGGFTPPINPPPINICFDKLLLILNFKGLEFCQKLNQQDGDLAVITGEGFFLNMNTKLTFLNLGKTKNYEISWSKLENK